MKKPSLVLSWDDAPIMMDIPYVARILGVTPESVRRYCEKGLLPASKVFNTWRIEKELLQAHMAKNRNSYREELKP